MQRFKYDGQDVLQIFSISNPAPPQLDACGVMGSEVLQLSQSFNVSTPTVPCYRYQEGPYDGQLRCLGRGIVWGQHHLSPTPQNKQISQKFIPPVGMQGGKMGGSSLANLPATNHSTTNMMTLVSNNINNNNNGNINNNNNNHMLNSPNNDNNNSAVHGTSKSKTQQTQYPVTTLIEILGAVIFKANATLNL
ncbi:hypothetical protein HELRODRAFT_182495 [Helobdella robusta]|uniref:Uncharacterized protein n=1 Tax=Helobdella robusta TaxID=6412 RepID=T1FI98_HELRO|nr:hypothetical protein HELRODRAFT_182495 [Helobdella robusta]ESN90907.1 hypothetical protein HELRODRAFT_182495 [Helobdella robusta]